ERAGRLILTSSSRTGIGLWQYNGWFTVLDAGAADAELGAGVAAALEQSTLRGPDDDAVDAVRRAVGARSYAALVRGTRHVSVSRGRRPSTAGRSSCSATQRPTRNSTSPV